MYTDRRRKQAFIGAIVSAASSIATGITNMVKKRKAEQQQKRNEISRNIQQQVQNQTQAMNNQLDSMNEYRDNFTDSMMRCGGKRKACGGKKACGGRKKAAYGDLTTDIISTIALGGSAIGSQVDMAGSQTANATQPTVTNTPQTSRNLFQDKTQTQVNSMQQQPIVTNNLINDAVVNRYGGRRQKACGGKKRCGGKKSCGGKKKYEDGGAAKIDVGSIIGAVGNAAGGVMNAIAGDTGSAVTAFGNMAANTRDIFAKRNQQQEQTSKPKIPTSPKPVDVTPPSTATPTYTPQVPKLNVSFADMTSTSRAGLNSANVIGDAIANRYGGRRRACACGGKKACGGRSKN